MIALWHRTYAANAAAILPEGFRDGTGHYMTDRETFGVWLSNFPLDSNEGAWGDTVLQVTLDCTEDEIREFEWIEDEKPYREFLVPASFIATKGKVEITNEP
jgi:hypothetical protein